MLFSKFNFIISSDAEELPGFIIVADGNNMDELMGRAQVTTKHGQAYFVDNVKAFMLRNKIGSTNVCYINSSLNADADSV